MAPISRNCQSGAVITVVPVIRNLNESFSCTCIFKVPVGSGKEIGRGKSFSGIVKERMASEGKAGEAQSTWIFLWDQYESEVTEGMEWISHLQSP